MARRHRAIRYKSSLVPRCGLSAPIPCRNFSNLQNCRTLIVTNDEDFINLLSSKGWPPKIILLKTGNQTNDYLFTKLSDKKIEIETFAASVNLGVLIIV